MSNISDYEINRSGAVLRLYSANDKSKFLSIQFLRNDKVGEMGSLQIHRPFQFNLAFSYVESTLCSQNESINLNDKNGVFKKSIFSH